LIIGGYNYSFYDGEVTFVDVESPPLGLIKYWAVELQAATFGDRKLYFNQHMDYYALVDSGCTELLVDIESFVAI